MSVVSVDLAYQGQPIDLNQTFLVVTNNYRATGNFPGVKDAAEKRLLNFENRQAIIDYIVSEKTINQSADGNWVSFQTLQMRISVLPHRIMHVPTLLIRMLLVMWGPSTQAGFAEYRLIVKEKQIKSRIRLIKNLRSYQKVLRQWIKLSA